MIALVRNIVTNEPQAVHRTAIDATGRKIDRKAYGPIGGGAVKLTDDANVTKVVAIGEGIETALSIRGLPDLDAMPVWSLISASGMSNFPILKEIERCGSELMIRPALPQRAEPLKPGSTPGGR